MISPQTGIYECYNRRTRYRGLKCRRFIVVSDNQSRGGFRIASLFHGRLRVTRALPSGVFGPVLMPPWFGHLEPRSSSRRMQRVPRRVLAPQRGGSGFPSQPPSFSHLIRKPMANPMTRRARSSSVGGGIPSKLVPLLHKPNIISSRPRLASMTAAQPMTSCTESVLGARTYFFFGAAVCLMPGRGVANGSSTHMRL
jgi:hypothetical protein